MLRLKFTLSLLFIFSYTLIKAQELTTEVTVQKLAGPRFGFTLLNKGLTDKLPDYFQRKDSYSPLVTQWGWQFETKFATLARYSGVVEFIPLVGGFEQGLFLPSFNVLMGLRSVDNWEIGAGPSLTLTGTGIVFAAGYNLQSGGLNFPLNAAVNIADGEARFTILLGFNAIKNDY